MEKIISKLFEPEIIMWLSVFLILFISKFGIGLNYISVIDIIKNHIKCCRGKQGKILIVPIINYIVLPFLMGAATMNVKLLDDGDINIITVIISILTAMLFTLLTMVIDMKAKIKNNSEYYSTEAKVSENALLETYYTIMYEILVSIVLLVLCFVANFTDKFDSLKSFLIYSLTYMLIINLMMVVKRVFRVIDTDMKK